MKNRYMPAMPNSVFIDGESMLKGGLTKREYLAGLAMQSGCAPCRLDDHHGRAAWAIAEADALLAELEATNDQ